MTKVLGIGGRLAAGKDTLADGLGPDWAKVQMSWPLWGALQTLDPYLRSGRRLSVFLSTLSGTPDEVYTQAKKIPEVRRLLQVLGTEVGRGLLGEDVWVNAMVREAEAALGQGRSVAITGVRFPNEVRAIRERLGGKMVWVTRDGALGPAEGHVSEGSVASEDFDIEVVNDGAPQDLVQRVLRWLDG